MYCKNCGAQLEAADKFCPSCGTLQEAAEEAVTPEVLPSPEVEAQKEEEAGKLLKKSITGAIFSGTGLLSLVGWIISAGARRRVRAYKEKYNELTGRALAAKIISGIGLGFGIGFTLYMILMILVAILAGL